MPETRPCGHGKARPGVCPVCRMVEGNPAFAARYGALAPAPAPAPPACEHQGRRVTVAGSQRAYHLCKSPRRAELKLAEVTCPCAGCGPGCRGYESEA